MNILHYFKRFAPHTSFQINNDVIEKKIGKLLPKIIPLCGRPMNILYYFKSFAPHTSFQINNDVIEKKNWKTPS